MSEYRYYEFLAIDRALTGGQMKELRAISTRARITSASFVNEYNWGDLKVRPDEMVRRYFDAFIYSANWGSRRFMMRLPTRLVDMDAIRAILGNETTGLYDWGEMIGIDLWVDEIESTEWFDAEGWLAGLVSLRNSVLAGDLRSLYLGWQLARVGAYSDHDEILPLPPSGLGDLSAPLKALVEFLDVSPDLLAAAAQWSDSTEAFEPTTEEFKRWIASIPAEEKNALLCQFAEGDAPLFRTELLRRWRREQRSPEPNKDDRQQTEETLTIGRLLDEVDRIRNERKQREAKKRVREETRQQRKEAARRVRYLKTLAGKTEETWEKIECLVKSKQPKNYDIATQFLVDLRDVAIRDNTESVFVRRLSKIRERHQRKVTFLDRLNHADLMIDSAEPKTGDKHE